MAASDEGPPDRILQSRVVGILVARIPHYRRGCPETRAITFSRIASPAVHQPFVVGPRELFRACRVIDYKTNDDVCPFSKMRLFKMVFGNVFLFSQFS